MIKKLLEVRVEKGGSIYKTFAKILIPGILKKLGGLDVTGPKS